MPRAKRDESETFRGLAVILRDKDLLSQVPGASLIRFSDLAEREA